MNERNVANRPGGQSVEPDRVPETPGAARQSNSRAYHKPAVTDFGTITKLTQNGQGSGADGGTGGAMAMMCL